MEIDDGEKDTESEVAELRLKVDSLKQELKECRAELMKVQKQLSHSDRLQRSTESYNEDLRKQVSADKCNLLNNASDEVFHLRGYIFSRWLFSIKPLRYLNTVCYPLFLNYI